MVGGKVGKEEQEITLQHVYRVTYYNDSNLLLTSKQKFRFRLCKYMGLILKRNSCFDVNGRFEST